MPPARLGPVALADGFRRRHAVTYLYGAFVTIGMLAFISFMQPYLLNANLKIPEGEQGRITGLLGFSNELVSLLLFAPVGALADKIGRRPVFALGFLWLAAGYMLYPLAGTVPQLLGCALVFAVGVSMVGCMLATVLADLPQERSRGVLVGITGFFQGLGAVSAVLLLGSIPKRLADDGFDAVEAGRITLWTAAALCVVTAAVLAAGLRKGTPSQTAPTESLREVLRNGVVAARENPRIWLAYLLSFAARGDLVVIGTFFTLRLTQAGIDGGMSVPDAQDAARRPYLLAQAAALLWALVFGFIMDRINRVNAGILAMGLAAIGYISAAFVGDPASAFILPVALALGVGQLSAILSGQSLLGEQAPRDVRGAVFGLASICGSLGILFTTLVGGVLYDKVTRGGPFMLLGLVNLFTLVFGLYVARGMRRRAA
jgi:MFS family permease